MELIFEWSKGCEDSYQKNVVKHIYKHVLGKKVSSSDSRKDELIEKECNLWNKRIKESTGQYVEELLEDYGKDFNRTLDDKYFDKLYKKYITQTYVKLSNNIINNEHDYYVYKDYEEKAGKKAKKESIIYIDKEKVNVCIVSEGKDYKIKTCFLRTHLAEYSYIVPVADNLVDGLEIKDKYHLKMDRDGNLYIKNFDTNNKDIIETCKRLANNFKGYLEHLNEKGELKEYNTCSFSSKNSLEFKEYLKLGIVYNQIKESYFEHNKKYNLNFLYGEFLRKYKDIFSPNDSFNRDKSNNEDFNPTYLEDDECYVENNVLYSILVSNFNNEKLSNNPTYNNFKTIIEKVNCNESNNDLQD